MNKRTATILEMLHTQQEVSIRDLASRFGVSEMTIRRDVAGLEKQGILVRRCGRKSTGKLWLTEESISCNQSESPAKNAIGRLAASLVKPGQTIMVDSGSTVLAVARYLPQNLETTVVTTSLCVAQELYGSSMDVILLAGILRKEFPGVCGPLTEMLVSDFHADVGFVGCDGANSQDGFYMADINVFNLQHLMIRAAECVVVVTESSKFRQRSFVRYATPRDVHIVLTDPGLSVLDRSNLEQRGVKVMVAGETV